MGAGAAGGVLEHAANKVETGAIAAKSFVRWFESGGFVHNELIPSRFWCANGSSKVCISGASDGCNEITAESSLIRLVAIA